MQRLINYLGPEGWYSKDQRRLVLGEYPYMTGTYYVPATGIDQYGAGTFSAFMWKSDVGLGDIGLDEATQAKRPATRASYRVLWWRKPSMRPAYDLTRGIYTAGIEAYEEAAQRTRIEFWDGYDSETPLAAKPEIGPAFVEFSDWIVAEIQGGATAPQRLTERDAAANAEQRGGAARSQGQEQTPRTTPPAPPTVSVSLLTRVVPTAYCQRLDATSFHWLEITVDNTGQGCVGADIRVKAVIEDYSDTTVATTRMSQGELLCVPMFPLLKPTAVAGLNEIRAATLRVVVEQIGPTPLTFYDQTEHVELLARNTALLAVMAPDGTVLDLTEYLVAWITPRHPEIERLLRRAVEYHPYRQIVGYQGTTTLAQGASIVREQARAIFTSLKQDADLVYVNSPLSLGAQAGQVAQRVRLPAESLAASGAANCIDGTVLFASLLELATIAPVVVMVPGHAFVGWRVWQGVDSYEFLETTMIGTDDFEAAQKSAQAQYDDVTQKGYFSRGLFDPAGFARLIDVAAARGVGIYPLE